MDAGHTKPAWALRVPCIPTYCAQRARHRDLHSLRHSLQKVGIGADSVKHEGAAFAMSLSPRVRLLIVELSLRVPECPSVSSPSVDGWGRGVSITRETNLDRSDVRKDVELSEPVSVLFEDVVAAGDRSLRRVEGMPGIGQAHANGQRLIVELGE